MHVHFGALSIVRAGEWLSEDFQGKLYIDANDFALVVLFDICGHVRHPTVVHPRKAAAAVGRYLMLPPMIIDMRDSTL